MPRRQRDDESDSDSSSRPSRDSSRSPSVEKGKASSKSKVASSSKRRKDSPRQDKNSRGDFDQRNKRSPPAKMRSPRFRDSSRGNRDSRTDGNKRDERERDYREAGRQEERSRDRSSGKRDNKGMEERKRSRDRLEREKRGESRDSKSNSRSEKSGHEKAPTDFRKSSHGKKKSPTPRAKGKPSPSSASKKGNVTSSSEDSSGSDSSDSENESQTKRRKSEGSGRNVEISSDQEDKIPKKRIHRSRSADNSSDSSSSDSNDDDDEDKIKKSRPEPKEVDMSNDVKKYQHRRVPFEEDNEKREVVVRENVEKRGDTPEKKRKVELVEEGEVEDDDDEEKEEGEISEDEDESPAKPLIAISEDMSDISSEDETQLQQAAESKQGKPEPTRSPKTPETPVAEDQMRKVDIRKDVEEESSPPRKVERSTDHRKSLSPSKTVDATARKAAEPKRESKQRKNDKEADTSYSDRDVKDGEDNSRRERPVLESDSEEDEEENAEGKKSVRSRVESKTRMGSSVSVVKPKENITDKSGEKDRDRGRGREYDRGGDRDSRRERDHDVDRRKLDRNERDDRRRRNDVMRGRGDDDRRNVDTKRRREDRQDLDVARPSSNKDAAKRPSSPSKTDAAPAQDATPAAAPAKKPVDDITTKTGGAYIPPAKLRMMQAQITDKTSVAYQRMSWEALKKSINGHINKVNVSNIINIIKELFQENIVRGRGLLARSVIQAQAASPTFTHVYAALVAVINTKFPQNGELILRRLILLFRRGYRRNNKALCLSTTQFIAHLVNQQVAHEVLALEILTLLLETPTDDSVEIAIGFLKECGQKLTEVSPRGINSIFERLRNILHEGLVDLRVEYMVEAMFAIRKDGFKDHPAVLPDLDLVEEEEQFTHLLQVEDAIVGEEMLNVFKEDKSFLESEEKYKELKKEILEEGSSDEESEEGSSGSESSESDEEAEERENAEKQKILDQTETNLVALRRTIYLTIQSSLDHNECAHKMLKMELKPGQEVELCNMILDCCAQLRTYEKFFGLLAQRFCQIDKKYIEPFQQIFCEQYETIHRLETNKLRNVAKFFAHMLHTDAISWGVLSVVKLTEEDTTSASRIFLKILFQELSEYLGLLKLNQRLKDPTLAPFFEGIMPRDNPKNTRFSINFFTTIGLGGLTDDLREHLKNVTRKIVQEKQDQAEAELAQKQPSSSSSSDDSDSSSSEDNSDSSDSSDSESDSHPNRKKKSTSSSAKARKVSEKSPIKSKHRKDERAEKRAKEKKQSNDMKRKFDREDRSSHDRMDRERLGGKNVSSKDKKRSRSRGKDREMNGRKKASPEKAVGIAARLLSMAQYGDIAQAAGESTSESRRNGTETKKGRDARKDRSADRGRQRRARSSEDEMARDIAGRGGSRQRNDRSESKDGKYRDDQRTKNRGRNDFDERVRDMERDFHAKDSHSWNDTRDFRNREGRDQRNSNRDNVHHEVKDGRERDSRSDRGHNFIEGRRDKDYPDWNRPRDGGRKRIREENGDRRLERPRGGEEMRKRRHDSSSGSSASSGSEASDVDKGRKRKEMQADAKGSKAAKNSVRAGADFKRQHSSPSPSKKKHARMSHPSASPSSSRSSSDKEISERKITIKKRGLSPSKDQKLKKATNSSSSSKQTKSKLLANNNSKKRPRSASSSSDSGSDSESSAASSDDSSSSGDEKISHKTEARARVEKQRRREGEDESRRRGKEMSSAARGRNEKIRGNDSRSRERKVRR